MRQLLLKTATLLALGSLSFASNGTVQRYYVRSDAPGNGGNGSSWPNAFRYLQDALDEAETTLMGGCGCTVEIWVRDGVYYPDESSANPTGSGNRAVSFELLDECKLYGGFLGNETSIDQRDLSNPNLRSELSGAIGNGSTVDNTYHVVDASFGSTSDAGRTVLDGFRIVNGYCQDQASPSNNRGAGILASFGRANIANCIIDVNLAVEGGGMACTDGGRLRFVNCLFQNNEASDDGGAGFVGPGQTRFDQCVISNNQSADFGGALTLEALVGESLGELRMTSCTFADNTSANGGDDLFARGTEAEALVWNTIFWSDDPIRLQEGSSADLRSPVIRGGVGGATVLDSASLMTSGAQSADPLFRGGSQNPYETAMDSPVAGTGDPSGLATDYADLDNDGDLIEATPLDFSYGPRTQNLLDRGAYETCGAFPYCTSSPNSVSTLGAALTLFGSCRLSEEDLTLVAGPVPNQPGIFYYGTGPNSAPFGNGIRCVSGSILRLPVVVGVGNTVSYDLDWNDDPVNFTPGTSRFFQLWYRDPAAGGSSFNLSDAVEVAFQP